MVTIDVFKHNKFREVVIPRAAKLVSKYGLTRPGLSYSGEEAVPTSTSKVDAAKEVANTAFEDNA